MKTWKRIKLAMLAVAVVLGILYARGYLHLPGGKPPMTGRPHLVGERMKFVLGKTAFDVPAVYYNGGAKNYLNQLSDVYL